MRAEQVYDIWEENQILGLSTLLKRIVSAAKSNVVTSMEVRQDKITEEQVKALRRRNFQVVYKDLVNKQYTPMVLISWDQPK